MKKYQARDVQGVLLLNKSTGLSSNAALQRVKRLFQAKKAGHTGSLDPLADGMLPICFGRATKFSQYLLDADKTYFVRAKLGVRTTTGDAEGDIVAERELAGLKQQELDAALNTFRGAISQVPSMYSALKYQGVPLYKLARQGIEVPRPARPITIYELQLQRFEPPLIELEMRCSKGTYVRTLVDDLGELLGCGAHVVALQRLSVAHFQPAQMISFAALEALFQQQGLAALDQQLLPIAALVGDLPRINITSAKAFYLRRGDVVSTLLPTDSGFVSMYLNQTQFIGVGKVVAQNKLAPARMC